MRATPLIDRSHDCGRTYKRKKHLTCTEEDLTLYFYYLGIEPSSPMLTLPPPPLPHPPPPPPPTSLAAALYGSSFWPSLCVQNAFLHYQRLAAECHQLGLNKLEPCSQVDYMISSNDAVTVKGIVKSKSYLHFFPTFIIFTKSGRDIAKLNTVILSPYLS